MTILGVSVDGAAANAAFRAEHDLPFPLLCDTDRKVSMAYGAADGPDAKYARRIAVLIGEDGRVREYWPKADPRTFAATALEALGP